LERRQQFNNNNKTKDIRELLGDVYKGDQTMNPLLFSELSNILKQKKIFRKKRKIEINLQTLEINLLIQEKTKITQMKKRKEINHQTLEINHPTLEKMEE